MRLESTGLWMVRSNRRLQCTFCAGFAVPDLSFDVCVPCFFLVSIRCVPTNPIGRARTVAGRLNSVETRAGCFGVVSCNNANGAYLSVQVLRRELGLRSSQVSISARWMDIVSPARRSASRAGRARTCWMQTFPEAAEVIPRVALSEVDETLEMTPEVRLLDVPPVFTRTMITMLKL